MAAKCSDEDFIRLVEERGIWGAARHLGQNDRTIRRRRERLEEKFKRQITVPDRARSTRVGAAHPKGVPIGIDSGTILVGSDAHYWPGEATVAHRAFVDFCRRLSPKAVVMNGDVMDCASISRFPPIGWESSPTLEEEIGAVQRRMREITDVTPDAEHIWTLGNHDGRFETRLATVAPEFSMVHGVHLKDHFPEWTPCWSVWINDDIVIKHRFKGGDHAVWNNTIKSGKSIITGHLHSLKVTPFTDYNGTRWGVDSGTLAEPYGPQFTDYTEESPVNWRSGFVVLTFDDGELLDPEIVRVWDDSRVCFRGELFHA